MFRPLENSTGSIDNPNIRLEVRVFSFDGSEE